MSEAFLRSNNCVGSGADAVVAAVEEEKSRREGEVYVKVMTDEQMELLRRQIAVYATICEQLVEMHKAVSAQQDSLAGMRLAGLYSDSLMVQGGHKIAARQRWTPTTMQLQILESLFDQGHGTPSKQKIKEITLDMSQHGQISETNVYNWFQNRRARSKRKQTSLPSNNESEADADDESPSEKKPKPDKHPQELMPSESDTRPVCNSQMNAQVNQVQAMYKPNDSSRSSGSSGCMPYFGGALSNHRVDHLMGNIDMSGTFCPFQSGDGWPLKRV